MGGGCSLLTELCGIVRGTGSGVRQATRKFLQEKLDKVRPATAEERKEILSLTHAESHMGENMLFNMIWEDGYWWETLWKECKKLTRNESGVTGGANYWNTHNKQHTTT